MCKDTREDIVANKGLQPTLTASACPLAPPPDDFSHLCNLKVLEREENSPSSSSDGMVQSRDPQLVLADEFTLIQAL